MSGSHTHDSHSDSQDYSGVMSTYKRLEGMGLKAEADAVMNGISQKFTLEHPAPPEVIQEGLEGILAKHKSSPHEASARHEPTHTAVSKSGNYVIGGLGALATALASYYGAPILGAFALATTVLTLYNTNRPEPSPAKNKR